MRSAGAQRRWRDQQWRNRQCVTSHHRTFIRARRRGLLQNAHNLLRRKVSKEPARVQALLPPRCWRLAGHVASYGHGSPNANRSRAWRCSGCRQLAAGHFGLPIGVTIALPTQTGRAGVVALHRQQRCVVRAHRIRRCRPNRSSRQQCRCNIATLLRYACAPHNAAGPVRSTLAHSADTASRCARSHGGGGSAGGSGNIDGGGRPGSRGAAWRQLHTARFRHVESV